MRQGRRVAGIVVAALALGAVAAPGTAQARAGDKCWKVDVSISDNPLGSGDFKWGMTLLKSWCARGNRILRSRQSATCSADGENGWVVEAGSALKESTAYASNPFRSFTWSTKCKATFGKGGENCNSAGAEAGGGAGSVNIGTSQCNNTTEQEPVFFYLNYNAGGKAKGYCIDCQGQTLDVGRVKRTSG